MTLITRMILLISLTILLPTQVTSAQTQPSPDAENITQAEGQTPDPEQAAESDTQASQQVTDPEADTSSIDESDVPADEQQGEEQEELLDDPYLVGWLELDGILVDGPPKFAWVDKSEQPTSTREIIDQLKRVAADPRYLGVTIRLDQPYLSLTQIQEITNALREVKEAGQTVLVSSDHYDLHSYLFASVADKVILQQKGLIELSGLGVEETYMGGLLELVGAKADLLQVGKYKGADESMTRKAPSEAWSSNIDALLDDLYGLFLSEISFNRKIESGQMEQLMLRGWTMPEEEYVESGLVDHIATRDLIDITGLYYGDDFEWDDLLASGATAPNLDNPFAMFSLLFKEPQTSVRRASIAVVHVQGPIVSGESNPGGMFDEETVGSATMIDVLADARDNDLIKGVILRIDSPGGSALASELIWQATRELGETKPVYASIGSMAASGGYYIACAAHEVYTTPGSILGSIGVVGGKIVLGDLYEKIGVSVHRRSRGPLGDMFNSVEVFDEQQRVVLNAAMQRVYDQFTNRITIGRGKRIADLPSVAQGRLFTGRQSVNNGLADKVGGLSIAIKDLADQLDLEQGSYDVVDLPEPLGFAELLDDMFGVQARSRRASAVSSMANTARMILGPYRWRAIGPILTGTLLLNQEHVLTLLPAAIVVR